MGKCDFYELEDRNWPNHLLDRAAIVGHTTHDGARIWIRVRQPGSYWLVVMTSPIPEGAEPGVTDASEFTLDSVQVETAHLSSASFSFNTDCTHVFDVGALAEGEAVSLAPATRYYYGVFVGSPRANSDGSTRSRWELGSRVTHSFATLAESPDRLAFGFFSCHKPYAGGKLGRQIKLVNMELWDRLREEMYYADASFVVGGGDQVYVDGHKKLDIWRWLKKVIDEDCFPDSDGEQQELMAHWYRDIYRGYWGHSEVRALFRSYPTYMTWDDHEICDGWGSYTNGNLKDLLDRLWKRDPSNAFQMRVIANMRRAAERVYREYQHSHNPRSDHLDFGFSVGDVDLYVWDARGKRDYTAAGKPVLGEEQIVRFESWLAQSSAKVVFVVSSIPMVHVSKFVVNWGAIGGLKDDIRDSWEHSSHRAERDRLLELVFKHSHDKGVKVAFLSGDVHIGSAFRLRQPRFEDASVHQLTSSAITWSSVQGELLRLGAATEGVLGHSSATPKKARTYYERLHVAEENNFAIVDVRKPDLGEEPVVRWMLYQDAHKDEQVSRLTPVQF